MAARLCKPRDAAALNKQSLPHAAKSNAEAVGKQGAPDGGALFDRTRGADKNRHGKGAALAHLSLSPLSGTTACVLQCLRRRTKIPGSHGG